MCNVLLTKLYIVLGLVTAGQQASYSWKACLTDLWYLFLEKRFCQNIKSNSTCHWQLFIILVRSLYSDLNYIVMPDRFNFVPNFIDFLFSPDKLCPPGQVYEDCVMREDGLLASKGLACIQTCDTYLLNLTCSNHEPCVPGCICPAGWVHWLWWYCSLITIQFFLLKVLSKFLRWGK